MSNINFANPYLLLLGIVLLVFIAIPFIIAIRKENLNKKNIASMIIHVVMAILITLALAKMTFQAVITETNVYVVADVSYSANKNLSTIDSYVENLEGNVPKNTKIGVVVFGKDYKVLYHPGESKRSIALSQSENMNNRVDDSQTDIASALEYTATLFEDSVIKRIVLITDGKSTNESNLVSTITNLSSLDIYVDAIYLNNNIKEDAKEVQINSLEYSSSTYLNKDQTVSTLIQSSFDTNAYLVVNKNNVEYSKTAVRLSKGFNVLSTKLDTATPGEFDYEVKIETSDDENPYNNSYYFHQTISEKVRVLFISENASDAYVADKLYSSDTYEITYYNESIKGKSLSDVPYSIEELCYYDEIVLSNVDVRNIYNSTVFLSNVDKVVSRFGKSLTTFGNTYTQNNDNAEVVSSELEDLSAMLPVNFGNQNLENRFVTLVIDYSYSMNNYSKKTIAKRVGEVLTDLMTEKDLVMLVAFNGEVYLEPAVLGTDLSKVDVKNAINNYEPGQGTFVGSGLNRAYQTMNNSAYQNYNKQIYLISDGYSSETDVVDEEAAATTCARNGISVSTITVGLGMTNPSKMSQIATNGKGKFYVVRTDEEINSIVLNDVFDDITLSVIENVDQSLSYSRNYSVLDNVSSLPNIKGFYNGASKASAHNVITTSYQTEIRSYEVPIYSYWSYGNGKVSSFSCDIANKYQGTNQSYLLSYWLNTWTEETQAYTFLRNILEFSTPDTRVDTPYIYSLDGNGTNLELLVEVPAINTAATVEITITNPNGEDTVSQMIWNNEYYAAMLNAELIGKYQISLAYTLRGVTTTSNYTFNISYLPEYNSFESFDASSLNYMVSENGNVSEDGNLKLVNDNSNVTTFTYDFTVVFMIICVCLFILDIIVRRVRWADIKSLFKRINRKKA